MDSSFVPAGQFRVTNGPPPHAQCTYLDDFVRMTDKYQQAHNKKIHGVHPQQQNLRSRLPRAK